MEDQLLQIKIEYLEKIQDAGSLKELDGIFLELFGKNGVVNKLSEEFPKVPKEERPKIGPLFNQIKSGLEKEIEDKREKIREAGYQKLNEERMELSHVILVRSPRRPHPGSKKDSGVASPAFGVASLPRMTLKKRQGRLHPITILEKEIVDLFTKLGFSQFNAPHIDTDEYNFEMLNIPKNHPARDLWDTLYIDTHNLKVTPGELLLRTHTSNAQVRIMKELKPPIRMMIIDRCFRYENLDARHEHTLDQFEIVYIDKGVSMANLQYLSEYFFKGILGQDIKARLRPKYYPFVEPGTGVDGLCIFCKGQGCKICGGVGWLELAGAGMIHPQVLKNGGIDPNEYSGIAWGFGPARIAMLKYGVEDIRLFNSGNLKLLEKF